MRGHLSVCAGAFTVAGVVAAASPAAAQVYPTKQIELVVPFVAGGTTDNIARMIAQRFTESWSQTVIVNVRPGGGSVIGTAAVAKAPPDGHTLLVTTLAFSVIPAMQKLPYDPVKDFAPVSLMCSTATLIGIHPAVPAASIKELVALVKANPGKYSYASAGTGTPAHLAGELFKSAFGLDITHVPFTGGNPAMTSTIGGHTPIIFPALSTAVPFVKGGQLRPLAVMSAKRGALLPDVPTMAELGNSDQEADVIVGLLVPAGTRPEIIDLLNREIVKAMAQPEVRERLGVLGFDPVASTPGEFAQWIKAELPKWDKVIRDANIKNQ
jgi:tripartite-type tricarboxylate transporter receptor subunit TctC